MNVVATEQHSIIDADASSCCYEASIWEKKGNGIRFGRKKEIAYEYRDARH